jgi:hypothetical protein
MSTDTKPFRFLDLPKEVRFVVYEHLFAGSVLVNDDCSECRDELSKFRIQGAATSQELDISTAYGIANLPGILTASKLTRTEASPIFSSLVTLYFGCQSFYSIPPYLERVTKHVKTVVLQDPVDGFARPTIKAKLNELLSSLAQLQTLHLILAMYPAFLSTTDDKLADKIIEHVDDHLPWERGSAIPGTRPDLQIATHTAVTTREDRQLGIVSRPR